MARGQRLERREDGRRGCPWRSRGVGGERASTHLSVGIVPRREHIRRHAEKRAAARGVGHGGQGAPSARGVRLILGRCSFISRAKLRPVRHVRVISRSLFRHFESSSVMSFDGATPTRGDAAMARGRQRPRDEHVLDQVRPLVASILESPLEHRAEASAEPDEKMRPPTRPLPAPLAKPDARRAPRRQFP